MQIIAMWSHAGRPPAQVLGQGVMHSREHVVGWALILDLEALSRGDLRMAAGCFRLQFPHRLRAGSRDLPTDPDQLLIPHLQHARALLSCSHPFQQAVPLLEDPPQSSQGARVARLNLHQHLVQKYAPLLGAGLDEAEVVRPEESDAENARQVEGSLADAIDLDDTPRPVAVDRQRDGKLDRSSAAFNLGVNA